MMGRRGCAGGPCVRGGLPQPQVAEPLDSETEAARRATQPLAPPTRERSAQPTEWHADDVEAVKADRSDPAAPTTTTLSTADMMLLMGAGTWIEQLRARHGLSQAQLAYRAGTSQQAISRIERGVVSPSVAFLERLAAACGEELVLDAHAREVPFEEAQLAEQAAMPMADRLLLASSWNRLAGEITGLAAQALRDG